MYLGRLWAGFFDQAVRDRVADQLRIGEDVVCR